MTVKAVTASKKMLSDFSTEYAQRSDDELLLLASDRASLTSEASAALDAELGRRNLTQSDQRKYQHFVHRSEQREAKKRLRKLVGTPQERGGWLDVFWALFAMSVIAAAYLALPERFQLKPDWQGAAVNMMFASVFIAVSCRFWWRKVAFWFSLIISSGIHLVVVRAWILRVGSLGRSQGQLAVLLGFALFFAVWILGRSLYGDENA